MNILRILVPLILFSIGSTTVYSQEGDGEYLTIRDLESWGSLNFKYKLNDYLKIGLEQQFRFKEDASKLDAYFTELNINYDFTDYIFGGIGFRYIIENDDVGAVQGLENHIRFHFDVGYKRDIKRFDLESRFRLQTKNELGITKEEGDYLNNHLRLKVRLKYNIKDWKLDPEVSSEIFRQYGEDVENRFNKFRFTVGTNYKLKNWGKIGAFYRMDKALNTHYPMTTNILGLKYTYTLKNNKK